MQGAHYIFCVTVHHDWLLGRVLIDIKSIPDLSKIEYSKVCQVHVTSFVSVCCTHAIKQKTVLRVALGQ